jgi:uncharacterized protein YjbI with pentapeptide repeats
MSDDEQQQAQPDDSEPTPARQAELRAAYEANMAEDKAPYAGVVIQTRGELNWIVRERQWQTSDFDTLEQVIDLRHVGFASANFSDVPFPFANLSGVVISYNDANFSGANFMGANLSGAFFVGDNVNFSGANLTLANLSGAFVGGDNVNISGANLALANLSGAFVGGDDANFSGADFTGANLSGALLLGKFSGVTMVQVRMDAATILGSSDDPGSVQLDATTRLLDVAWNGAILVNVAWEQVPRLGDEADIKAATSRKERVQALRNAARAYRGLAKALQAQGVTIPALKYRIREQQLERRAQLYSFAIGPWLFSWLLNIVSGYGDKPGRALACYLAVVGTFMAAYWAMTNQVFGFIQSQSAHLKWYEALVLSISSFHGRGFFPSMLSLGDPIALVAAAEAIIGLFIELVFIATFTQRFFAR